MIDQPPLIKGAPPPAKRKFAKSWTLTETEFITWLRDAWNKTFDAVDGGRICYNTRHNNGAASRFFRRNAALPTPFTRDDIAAAIKAYSEDPANVKLRSFKFFKDFIDEAEDRIAHQLKRTGRKTGADDKLKAAALRVVEYMGLDQIVRSANQSSSTETTQGIIFGNHNRLQKIGGRRSLTPSEQSQRTRFALLSGLVHGFTGLSEAARCSYFRRSMVPFMVAYGRATSGTRDDSNAIYAIALALLDLDNTRTRKERPRVL